MSIRITAVAPVATADATTTPEIRLTAVAPVARLDEPARIRITAVAPVAQTQLVVPSGTWPFAWVDAAGNLRRLRITQIRGGKLRYIDGGETPPVDPVVVSDVTLATATATEQAVTFTVDTTVDAVLEVRPLGGTDWTLAGVLTGTGTLTITATGLTADTAYDYRITAPRSDYIDATGTATGTFTTAAAPRTELGTITVTPLPITARPAQTTYQQYDFTTNDGLAVARSIEFRRTGTTTWTPTRTTPIVRTGTHTATIGGPNDGGNLTPGTSYDYRIRLEASGYDPTTLTGTFTTATAGLLVWDHTMYPPSSDTWERVWWLPAGSAYSTPSGERRVVGERKLLLSPTDKVRAVCPEVFVNPGSSAGNSEIVGGSWRLQGFLVKFTGWRGALLADGQPPAIGKDYNPAEPNVIANWWLKIVGNGVATTGAFRAIEGGGVLPADDGRIYCWEGRYYDGKLDVDDTLVDHNWRIAAADRSHGISWIEFDSPTASDPNRKGHSGGDGGQQINGPAKHYRRGIVIVTSYQGEFMQYDVFGEDGHVLQDSKRVEYKGDRGDTTWTPPRVGGHTQLWWDASRSKPGVERIYGTGADGVYLDPVPGKTRDGTIKEASAYTHDDPIVIGPAPRDLVPLSELKPYDPLDARWVAGR